jgi:hypothetical protein
VNSLGHYVQLHLQWRHVSSRTSMNTVNESLPPCKHFATSRWCLYSADFALRDWYITPGGQLMIPEVTVPISKTEALALQRSGLRFMPGRNVWRGKEITCGKRKTDKEKMRKLYRKNEKRTKNWRKRKILKRRGKEIQERKRNND